ncbi:MAG TPA: winged helix-turn-helix domain-containing protein [Candidatus Acidoferrales bacterium]|nr:winged helix-turn-helix domain-containing protein [Candidatus Acidoferrales bacterium]
MAVPDFQTIMLPLMRYCQDGKEHSMSETVDALSDDFKLTEEERKALLPNGVQEIFRNWVAWAKSHLKMAGLLANPRRGIYQITERRLEVLRRGPSGINLRFLNQFPEYVEFRTARRSGQSRRMKETSTTWQLPRNPLRTLTRKSETTLPPTSSNY